MLELLTPNSADVPDHVADGHKGDAGGHAPRWGWDRAVYPLSIDEGFAGPGEVGFNYVVISLLYNLRVRMGMSEG